MKNKSQDDKTRVVNKDTDSMTTRVVDIDNKTNDTTDFSSQKVVIPRRSGRIRRPPERYEANIVVPDTNDEDPSSYEEAMMDFDKEKWHEAMNQEMESMYSNSVWELVDLPEGFRPIGNKWIYKRKKGADGKVETYKARLVAKCYTKKEGVDYEETFSPVAMLKSIRILLSMAASLDYEIWQMDVKTAFLNGNLDEEIYMSQPEGFQEKDQEQKVCRLLKSIYGLKQASRSWNIRFDETIKSFGFHQSVDEACIYKMRKEKSAVFLVLYVDDILLMGDNVKLLTEVKD